MYIHFYRSFKILIEVTVVMLEKRIKLNKCDVHFKLKPFKKINQVRKKEVKYEY